MDEAGFPPDTIAIIAPTPDGITFTAWNGEHDEYTTSINY
jgi:hypothetical protein